LSNLQLFAGCVAIWGSTWLAIPFQLGRVAPEASVGWRFLLASLLLFAFCLARRLPLRYSAREHAWIALQGMLMFSVSYIYVYYAEENVVSGLVAVGYSASPLLAMLGMRLFFRTPMTGAVIAGSILGIAGITLVFWPEFAHLRGDRRTALGAVYTAVAVLVATLGTIAAHRNHEARLPLWQGMAWGMLYGGLFSIAVALATGKALTFELSAPYVLSLLYLALLGSIVAFAGYLTLMKRIGAARAGYIGVMVPIVALVVSAAFEGFHWQALTVAGIAVSVAGNVVVLRERAKA
jgi:drug/metabolite transporter (DMT)-like permease